MAKVIGAKKIIELLEAAVEEKGETHQANCIYRAYNTESRVMEPHCIAAQVVYKLGGGDALNKLKEGSRIYSGKFTPDVVSVRFNGELSDNPQLLKDLGLTDKAMRVLQEAQGVQDSGGKWGFALDSAKQVANV